MNMDWRKVVIGGMMGVVMVGCASHPAVDPTEAKVEAADPNARAFHGSIVSLRPMKSTMLISKDDKIGNDRFPNIITVKWNAQTKFFIDGAPATLDQIRPYMNVQVVGHMQEGELFADTARFATVIPGVKPTGSAQAQ